MRPRIESLEPRLMLDAALPGDPSQWLTQQASVLQGQWILSMDGPPAGGVGSAAGVQAALDAVQAQSAGAAGGGLDVQVVKQLGAGGPYLLRAPDTATYQELMVGLSETPGFRYLEPNFALSIDMTIPNDARFSELYGMHNTGQTGGTADADIDAPEAWDLNTGSGNIVVGVIDTGVDYTHVDLAANMWTNPGETPGDGIDNDGNGYIDDIYGWDFYNNDSDPWDDHSHGTHVSGTIAGVGNDGVGVVGVNWSAQIMALKFLSSGGSGSTADAIEAVNYATMMRRDYGVNIVLTSNSWGGGGYSVGLEDAIAAGAAQNMLFIAAAGNDNENTDIYPHYPSSYDLDNIISVAGTDHNDARYSSSNYGVVTVDLAAAAVNVLSSTPGNNYGTKTGTSMATPHVAGVAALAWDMSPNATYQQVRDVIFASVDVLPSQIGRTATEGRLNAYQTLLAMGIAVAGSSPAQDEVVFTQPVDFSIDFSSPYDPASVAATDLLVNGAPADSFTLTDADTVTFHFNVSPVTAEGSQGMAIAAGAIARLSDGDLIDAWTAYFRYDVLLLSVSSTTPPDGSTVTLPFTSLRVSFNEPYAPGTLDVDDLTLSRGNVTAVAIIDTTTVEFTLDGVLSEDALGVSMAAGAMTDTHGNPMGAYSGTLYVDVGTSPYPTPLEPVSPLGSMIYDPSVSAWISFAGDTDSFTLDVDAGQTITVLAQPDATLQPTLDLSDTSGVIGSATAGGAGQEVVLQTVPAALGGTYMITVGGVSGSTGGYTVQVILNAAVEDEEHGGPANDTLATAQDVDAAFLSLAGAGERAGVLGALPAAAVNEDWYSLTLGAGEPVTLAASTLAGGSAHIEFYDSAGALAAVGRSDVANVSDAITDFVAPAAGSYYVRVLGQLGYSLVIMCGAAFELGGNSELSTAQDIALTGVVLGSFGGGGVFFAIDRGNDNVYAVDPETGASVLIGNAGYDLSFCGLSYDGGPLYVSDIYGSDWSLGTLDLETGAGTIIGAQGDSDIHALFHLNGTLYGFSIGAGLGVMDTATGAFASLPDSLPVEMRGADLDESTATVYTLGEDNNLYTVDVGTGSAVLVGSTGVGFNYRMGLAYNPADGELYALGDNSGTDSLYLIDKATGAATLVGATALTEADGLEFVSGIRFGDLASAFGLAVAAEPAPPSDGATENGAPPPADPGLSVPSQAGPAAAVLSGGGEFYSVAVNAGDVLTVATATPAGDPAGEFVNDLDPSIELYDSAGNLVAADDNSAPDGRNAFLTHTALLTGQYVVRILAVGEVGGEYVLSVTGHTAALPALEVTATDPPDGAILDVAPTQVRVDFSDALLITSVDAADLTVNSVPATGVTVIDHDTVLFDLPASLPDAVYAVEIAAGAILDLQGTPLQAYAGQFEMDTTPPTVVSSSIQNGEVVPAGNITYIAQFSESMDPTNLADDDVSLVGLLTGTYDPSTFTYDPATSTLTLAYANLPEDAYTLTVFSGDERFEDLIGHDLDGEPTAWPIPPHASGDGVAGGDFVLRFWTDHVATPYPLPLELVEPAGSMIYESPLVAATISYAGDTDSFLVDLDPGQTISVSFEPDAGLGNTIVELYDPSGTLMATLGPAPAGTELTLQSAPVTVAGTYTLTVQGLLSHAGLFATDAQTDELYSIDPATGASTLVGALGRNTEFGGLSSGGGQLYLSNLFDGGPSLASVDTLTGLATPVGRHQTIVVSALAHVQGTMYGFGAGLGGGAIGTVDPATGKFTVIHSTALPMIMGADYDESTGTLYGLGQASGALYTIDVVAGTATFVGRSWTGFSDHAGLAYNPGDGQLYAVGNDVAGPGDGLYRIDRATGIGTFIGSTGLSRADALEFAVVGDTGAYSLQFTLNAAYEMEEHGGPSNDTPATAQDLDPAFLVLPAGAQRTAVVGTGQGASASVSQTVNDVRGSVVMNFSLDVSGLPAPVGDGVLHASAVADLADSSEYIALNVEGLISQDLFVTGGLDYSLVEMDVPLTLSQLQALAADGVVNMTATPTSAVGGSSGTYLTLELMYPVAGRNDFYSLTLTAGQPTTMRTEGAGGLRLHDSAGNLLAIGRSEAGASVIEDFNTPAAGTYYVEVVGDGDYALVVTRDAAFDIEPNNDIAGAQTLAGETVLGYAGRGWGVGGQLNFYVIRDGITEDSIVPLLTAQGHSATLSGGLDGSFDGTADLSSYNAVILLDGAGYDVGMPTAGQNLLKSFVSDGGGVIITEWIAYEYDGGRYSQMSELLPLRRSGGQSEPETYTLAAPHPVTEGLPASFSVPRAGANVGTAVSGTTIVTGSVSGDAVVVDSHGSGRIAQFAIAGDYDNYDPFNQGAASDSLIQLFVQAAEWVSGSAGGSADFYSISVNAGDTLTLSTATPGDSPGEFVNDLDPAIELYDPFGNLAASDDNSGPDGRNAFLTHTAAMSGRYAVNVFAVGEAGGEYVLSVTGHTGTPPALEVTATDPADGASLDVAPTQMTVDFSESLLLTSVDAADLAVNGIPATGATVVDHDTVIFDLPGGLAEGAHTVDIAAGALLDLQGTPVQAYTGQFRMDTSAPVVISSSIQDGDVLATGDLTYVVQFDEPLDETSLTASDVSLYGALTGYHSPESFSYDAASSTLTLEYAGLQEDGYALTLYSGDTRIEDLLGHDLDGEATAWPIPPNTSGDGVAGGDFVLIFSTDLLEEPFPTPLEPVAPAGSLIYRSTPVEAGIFADGDTDAYTLDVDAGQAITVLIQPDETLQPTVELFDPANVLIASASAAAAGDEVFLQSVPTATAGTYRVVVSGIRVTTVAASSSIRVGVVTDGLSSSYENSIVTYLGTDPRVASAVLYDTNVAMPTLTTLLADTDALLFTTDGGQDNSHDTILGDLLADYVDAGGGLVLSTFVWHSISSIGIGGRVMTTGYSPFIREPDQGYGGYLDTSTSNMAHPALESVTSFYAEHDSDDVTLDAGASAIAYYTDGDLLLAESGVRPILGLSAYPAASYLSGDYVQLVANCLSYVSGGAAPILSGAYSAEVMLNAALEQEEHGGPANDNLSGAEDLDPAFLALAGTAARAAVHGALPTDAVGVPVHSEGFESGVLGPDWTTYSSDPAGRVRVTDAYTPAAGNYALYMDRDPSGSDTLNEAIWTVDLSGLKEATLHFSQYEYSETKTPFAGDFFGHYNADGVAISDDGVRWHPVWDAVDPGGVWRELHIDLGAEASEAGMTLGPGFQIKFQQYDNYPITSEGRGWDEISITTVDLAGDWYSFSLDRLERSTLAVTPLGGGQLHVDLYDATGTLLAAGRGDTGLTGEAVVDFPAAAAGTYYARVVGRGEYALIVTQNASFDLGGNNVLGNAQDITFSGGVLGQVGGSLDRLYAFDNSGQLIREIDPVTGAQLNSFSSPVGVSSGPDFGLATTGSSVLAGGYPSSPIYELDPDTGSIIRTLTNPSVAVSGMAFMDGEIYLLTDATTGRITVLDYATGAVNRTITATAGVYEGLTAGDGTLYGMNGSSLYTIDPLTGASTLAGSVSQGGGEGMGILGDELFVGDSYNVNVYDLATLVWQRTLSNVGSDMEALGADGGGSGSDYYRFQVVDGDALTLTTHTPGGGPLEPVNPLDPAIELYDPSGNLVASDDNSAPDGRNALLTYAATETGVYVVRVMGVDETGEYFLSVSGHTGGIAPTISAVQVASSSWSGAFTDYLEAQGLGTDGYATPAGAAQMDPMPWYDLDRIQIVFSEDVQVAAEDIRIYGVEDAIHPYTDFAYDGATYTATWTLQRTLDEPEKLLIRLADDIQDANGNLLDGEWTDAVAAYPSGDGLAGGRFEFRLNILPGDVDASGFVNIFDTIKTRNRQFTAAGDAGYSIRSDMDGNGVVNIFDTIKVRNRQFTALPDGDPVAFLTLAPMTLPVAFAPAAQAAGYFTPAPIVPPAAVEPALLPALQPPPPQPLSQAVGDDASKAIAFGLAEADRRPLAALPTERQPAAHDEGSEIVLPTGPQIDAVALTVAPAELPAQRPTTLGAPAEAPAEGVDSDPLDVADALRGLEPIL